MMARKARAGPQQPPDSVGLGREGGVGAATGDQIPLSGVSHRSLFHQKT